MTNKKEGKCPRGCNRQISNCDCPAEAVCSVCVALGVLGPNNTCQCCTVCKKSQADCDCCKVCKQEICQCPCTVCSQELEDCQCCPRCRFEKDACQCCEHCKLPPTKCTCCKRCNKPPAVCQCPCQECQQKPCGCCKTCHNAPQNCSCECKVCQQLLSNCQCCRSCRKFPCDKCQHCKRRPCRCCPRCKSFPCKCCTKCRTSPCRCCPRCRSTPCACPPPVPVMASIQPNPQMQTNIEPPCMSVLKDRNKLEFYLNALENWNELQDWGGYPAERRAAVIFTYAFKTNPELCKQLTDHFKKTLKDDSEGVAKIVEWLKQKFGLNKHADIVRVINSWLNLTRKKQESLLDYISRFETAYNEVEGLGENISATTRSVLLLRQADLSNTDHQIITVNLCLDPKAPDADQQFEKTKEAMRKFQHTQMANATRLPSGSYQGAGVQTYLGDFIDNLKADDTVDEEVKQNITAYLAQQRSRGGGRGARHQGKSGRVWKCDYCLCDHKRYINCGCPCTKHTKDKCPNPDKAKVAAAKEKDAEEKKAKEGAPPQEVPTRSFYGYMQNLDRVFGQTDNTKTFMAKVVAVRESDTPQPLENLLETLNVLPSPAEHNYGRGTCSRARHSSVGRHSKVCQSDIEQHLLTNTVFHDHHDHGVPTVPVHHLKKIFLSQPEYNNDLEILVDTGSPATIIGVTKFKRIKEQYPLMIQNTFRYAESAQIYEFGGGEVTPSLGKVRLPMYVVDTEGDIQILWIWIEILQHGECPFLLGGRSMRNTETIINLQDMTFTIHWQDRVTKVDLEESNSGHLIIQFFPLSEQDDRIMTRDFVEMWDWTEKYSNAAINYLVSEDKEDLSSLLYYQQEDLEKILLTKHRKGDKKPLSGKEINKLHHTFGHAHPDKIKQIVKNADKYNEGTLAAIEKLRDCEVCKVENSRLPRPRIALPRSSAFGHVLAMDLKENRRFPNAPPYILYMVDTHTRFKSAVFIKDKRAETVAEAFITEWIKYHGPPRYIMTDRGNEFLGKAMRELCQFHDIRMTTTASHSPHQNAKAERGHAVVDRSMERMLTAQPGLKPAVALAWVIQAANTLQNVDGFSPFMLVFGRVPQHPSLVDANPGNCEELASSQSRWAAQYRAMMDAREAFTAAEADRVLRQALEQRIYANHDNLQEGDWVYFKRNMDRSWQGPAKLALKNGKSLHLVKSGQQFTINADDVLLNKPDMEESTAEDFVTLPKPGPASTEDSSEVRLSTSTAGGLAPGPSTAQSDPNTQVRPVVSDDSALTDSNPFHGNETESGDQGQPAQQPEEPDCQEQEEITRDQSHSPATSTKNSDEIPDLGEPVMCNLCQQEFSSLHVKQHIQQQHNIVRPNVRSLTTLLDKRPDSLYENVDKLRPGVVMVDHKGNYMVLVSPTDLGWRVRNLATKQENDLELSREMTEMRFVGDLETEEPEGIFITKEGTSKYLGNSDYHTKIFFTAQEQFSPEVAFVVNIPRSRHAEPKCVAAKLKELDDFSNYDVYDIVDRPEGVNIISTQWVLVEKDRPDGTTVTKARLCIEGNFEENRHLIPVDSPTVNPISIRLITTIGVSRGYTFQTADVQRAFLQSDKPGRDVFVRPPLEMGLPRNKVLKLKRTCYGLVDASRAFFIKQGKELTNMEFRPSNLDPALFIHKRRGEEIFDVATAVHVDDSLSVGTKNSVHTAQAILSDKFTYGSIESLPFRFLGQNYKRDEQGNLTMDTAHYVDKLELPDQKDFAHLAKQDVLPDQLQTTFRSLASKLNTISRSVRPDFSYQAKYLTTRYGKATKSDLTQAIKLLRRAKEETTEVTIPDIGQPEDWLLIGVADASHRRGAEALAVGGHVVLLLNKITHAASVLHWSSKKIDRVCQSPSAAETIALEKMFSTLYFVRQLLVELCGKRVSGLQCIAYTDNQTVYSNVHHLKTNTDDYRLQTNIISIRQCIEEDKIAQELRYCCSDENISDCLTKQTKSGDMLLNIVRHGIYDPPGGTVVRDSSKLAVRSWNELQHAEADADSAERLQKQDKTTEESKENSVKTLLIKQVWTPKTEWKEWKSTSASSRLSLASVPWPFSLLSMDSEAEPRQNLNKDCQQHLDLKRAAVPPTNNNKESCSTKQQRRLINKTSKKAPEIIKKQNFFPEKTPSWTNIKYERKDDTTTPTHQNLFRPEWRLSMRQSARPPTPGQAGSSQLSFSPLLEKFRSNIREFY